jgi:hypothetical protein
MKRIQPMLALLIVTAVPAWAHHSVAGYDERQTLMLSGTVKEFYWVNPHMFIYVDVPDKKGATKDWIFECGAPAINLRLGWKPTDVKNGDKITVEFNPAKDGHADGLGRHVWLANGLQRTCVGAVVGVGGPGPGGRAPGGAPPAGAPPAGAPPGGAPPAGAPN